MTGTEKLMEQIKAEVNKTEAPKPNTKFLCCSECKSATTFDATTVPPATCKFCGKEPKRWGIGETYTEAKAKIEASATASTPAAKAAAPAPAAKPAAPKPEPVKAAAPVEPPVAAPADQTNTTTVQPVGTATTVNQAAPKQRAARAKKPEPVAPASTATEPEPANAPAQTSESLVQAMNGLDLREVRRKAIERLTTTHNLDTVIFKPVGTAKIFALGFTSWERTAEGGSIPSYTFKELTDDAASFRQVLADARRENGKAMIDVAMLTDIEPQELRSCLYQSQLVASIFGERGPLAVKADSKVEVAARLSNSGGLVFRISKVL